MTAQRLKEFRSERAVYSSAFSPDGRRILIGCADRTARIRDVVTGEETAEAMIHPGGVWFTQFSPDGRIVATGDDAGAARLWDSETGLPVGNWLRSGASLKRIVFSPDGQWLITASSDHTARVWPVLAAPSPAPAWLPALAESIAGLRLDKEGDLESVPFEAWRNLRVRLLTDTAAQDNFYSRWARWFLHDRFVGQGEGGEGRDRLTQDRPR